MAVATPVAGKEVPQVALPRAVQHPLMVPHPLSQVPGVQADSVFQRVEKQLQPQLHTPMGEVLVSRSAPARRFLAVKLVVAIGYVPRCRGVSLISQTP